MHASRMASTPDIQMVVLYLLTSANERTRTSDNGLSIRAAAHPNLLHSTNNKHTLTWLAYTSHSLSTASTTNRTTAGVR